MNQTTNSIILHLINANQVALQVYRRHKNCDCPDCRTARMVLKAYDSRMAPC